MKSNIIVVLIFCFFIISLIGMGNNNNNNDQKSLSKIILHDDAGWSEFQDKFMESIVILIAKKNETQLKIVLPAIKQWGIDINRPRPKIGILLNNAILTNSRAIVAMIINEGKADCNALSPQGRPLCFAVRNECVAIAKQLLDCGAKVDDTSSGLAALHVAADNNNVACIELLLAYKAKIDAIDNNGNTPAHRAALKKSNEAFDFLKEKGANMKLENNEKLTPILIRDSHEQVYRNQHNEILIKKEKIGNKSNSQ